MFGLDSPFVKYMSLIADVIMLSVLFLVTSIPLVTIGPSVTALFFVMTRRIYEKESYLLGDYFKSFKLNFKQSIFTGILLFVLQTILCFNIYLVLTGYVFAGVKMFQMVAIVLYALVLIESFFVSLYVFPVISRFELSFKEAIKTSFMLANKHLATTISVSCIFVLIWYLTYANPFLLFATMGIYSSLASYFFMKVFRKYNPNMDLYEHEISYEEINKIKKDK